MMVRKISLLVQFAIVIALAPTFANADHDLNDKQALYEKKVSLDLLEVIANNIHDDPITPLILMPDETAPDQLTRVVIENGKVIQTELNKTKQLSAQQFLKFAGYSEDEVNKLTPLNQYVFIVNFESNQCSKCNTAIELFKQQKTHHVISIIISPMMM